MKEEIAGILERLSDEQLALIIAGHLDNVNLSEDDKSKLSGARDIASLVATEILARRKGFRVEETELLRIKTRGRFLGEVPLYEYEGRYFVIFEERAIEVPLKKPEGEPEKPKKRLGKGGIKLP